VTSAEIALVLLSALLHAIWSASVKGSASPLGFNLLQLLPPIAAACALAFFVPLDAIPSAVWWIVAGTGLCHGFYFYFFARALETGELSVVYPIARSAPAFLPLAAVPLLGERIDLVGGVGIAIVVTGMIAVGIDGMYALPSTRLEAAEPDSRVASQRRAARVAPKAPTSLRLALATLIASVGYSLFDKAGMAALAGAPWDAPVPRAIAYYVLLSIAGGLVFAPLALRRTPPREVARRRAA
jgi:multidrug transporter EmrE-like cation transporter